MERAGDLLKNIFKNKIFEKADKFSSFFRRWQMIVGEKLEKHTRVIDIKNHTLIVEADHPGWLQLLYIKKAKVLFLVKKLYPELKIKKMRIFLVKKQEQAAEKKPEKELDVRDNVNNSQEEAEVLKIKNLELREILKRFYSSIQENQ